MIKPLVVLIVIFGIICTINYLLNNDLALSLSGRIAMSAMLLFTGISHFKFTNGMELMIPDNFSDSYKRRIVLISGDLEIALAAALQITQISKLIAIFIMLYFLAIIPANIIACIKNVNIEKADDTGPGLSYLWFRIPLQIFFMVWIYYFGVYMQLTDALKLGNLF